MFLLSNDTLLVVNLYFFSVLCCCPGIDLMDMAGDVLQPEGDDAARVSWNMRKTITKYQETFSIIEKVGAAECCCFSH